MSSTEEAPTLYPNKEEFANPIKYLNSKDVVKLGEEYGILKIKPPKNWKPPFSINERNFKFHTRIQNLNELNLTNRSRQFWLNGFNNYLRMKGKQQIKNGFIALKNNSSKAVHLYDLYTGNNYHEYKDLFVDPKLFSNFIEYSIYLKKHLKNNKTELDSNIPNEPFDFDKFTSQINESYLKNNGNSKSNTGCEICKLKDDPGKILICDDCSHLYHMRCLNPPLKTIPKNDWFCDECLEGSNGDYGFEEDFDSIFTLNEFRKDCEEFKTNYCNSHFNGNMNPSVNTLEKEFWRLVEQGESRANQFEYNRDLEVRYGADIHNEQLDEISGFPMATNPTIDKEECKDYINHPFNLTNLPFAEGSLLNYIKDESREQISGMTVPWLYVGSMFSTFCWHKEDHYTLSANYCHLGETKKWYGIPASECDMFEYICHEISPDYFTKQPDLLHQLVSLLSPSKIYQLCKEKLNKKIKLFYVNQNPNEFVVTFPKVYHAGFNCGFNVNEAVNFTMPYWLNYGKESINEYQLVKKENVFNHYKLLRNILDGFLTKKEGDSLIGSESIFPANVISEMIKVAFTDYCSEIRKFKLILNDRNLLDFLKLINSKEYKDYLVEENEKKNDFKSDETADERSVRKSTRMTSMRTKNNNSEEDSIDEFICNDCKSFVNFKWIEIDTLKELENEFHMNNNNSNNTNNLNSSLLPTPNQSPVFAQEGEFRDAESSL